MSNMEPVCKTKCQWIVNFWGNSSIISNHIKQLAAVNTICLEKAIFKICNPLKGGLILVQKRDIRLRFDRKGGQSFIFNVKGLENIGIVHVERRWGVTDRYVIEFMLASTQH